MKHHIIAYFALITCFLAVFSLSSVAGTSAVSAQETQEKQKPKLVEIVLNEETNDPEAEKIVRKIFSELLKKKKKNPEAGKIFAKFVPMQKKGASERFIAYSLRDLPLGGCYAKGCLTGFMKDTNNNNKWSIVFSAFVFSAFYDESSREKNNANLIFSSDINNKNPGVWMWNGVMYEIVNMEKKK